MKKVIILVMFCALLSIVSVVTSCTPSNPTPPVLPTPVSAPSSTPLTAPSTQKVIITYSATTTNQIGTDVLQQTPQAGNTYIIFNMTIQNQGYDSFSINPSIFSLSANVANNLQYPPTFVNLDNPLPTVVLLSGGIVTGELAFEVPAGISNWWINYMTFSTYNIQWVKQ